MKPIVAIVGRPNVGKSTLFNRLIGARHAIVEDLSGVTRDRLYRDATWLDRDFTVIDTGGIDFSDKNDQILTGIIRQASIAIEEAHVIIFVTDSRTGLTYEDREAAEFLRRSGKPVVLAVNKMDNFAHIDDIIEFYELGLGEPIAISSIHGMNTGDLLDAVVEHFPPKHELQQNEAAVSIAVIGRPNVGKSSLTNRLLGKERSIVADMAGTTRDAIDSDFMRNGELYRIIDTAGMRRRGKIAETTERYSVARALHAVDRSDVVLMVIDAKDGVTEQDQRIAGYAHEAGKGLVVVVNKWDLLKKNDRTVKEYETKLRENLAFMSYAKVIYVSALTGQRVGQIMDLVDQAAEEQTKRVTSSRLNEVLNEAILLNPLPSDKGRRLKIFYVTQAGVKPPTFLFFVNDPELMHFSYLRYLENQLRTNFGFEGTPIWLKVIGRNEKEEENNPLNKTEKKQDKKPDRKPENGR
ncbi:MAG: ribosome biogenesis GTPase Der [Firmicutes bacterium]|nr:ribosome biogenesis GTPase Der [Bacillota bacterium]MBQ3199481.1 ribosome biogenesis GTPase Der [Bacillota bacterium]